METPEHDAHSESEKSEIGSEKTPTSYYRNQKTGCTQDNMITAQGTERENAPGRWYSAAF